MSDKALLNRIEELEARMAFQDDSLQALNDVIARQDRELAALRRELSAAADRLKGLALAMEVDNAPSPADEKPPHY